MIRYRRLEHRFVQHAPDVLEPAVLYVSVDYGTAVHACCCGCGEEVVTPFSPTDWKLTFDGETISLWPSIGSWNLACRSHYIIERGRVIDAGPWTDQRIAAARRGDRAAKAGYYCTPDSSSPAEPVQPVVGRADNTTPLARLRHWLANFTR